MTRNRFEAGELAQDAFLSVYEGWDRVAKMDEPTAYLYPNRHERLPFVSALLPPRTLGGACGTDQMVPWASEGPENVAPGVCHRCFRTAVTRVSGTNFNDVSERSVTDVPGSHSVEFPAVSGRSMGGGRWMLTELWEGGNRCA